LVQSGIYFPLFWKFTGLIHGEAGYVDDRTDSTINIDHKKFYLGGMKSLRAFDHEDINGKRPGNTKTVGGEKYVQFNLEVTFPLVERYNLAGLFFYDQGDVYLEDEDIQFGNHYSNFGTGMRWKSPFGPLSVAYAWVIEGKDVKEAGEGMFSFSVGASF